MILVWSYVNLHSKVIITQTKKNVKGATKPTETDWKNVNTLLDSRFLYLKQFIANGTLFCKVAYCLIVCLEIK